MGVIYRPKGRALEYSFLALNLYRGCSHRCGYCYVPGMLRMSRQQWESLTPQARGDVTAQLRRDAKQFAGTNERVLLCFTSDPYSPEAAASRVTRQALAILRYYDIPFQVLTKGGTRATQDFNLYGRYDAFATTMTFSAEDEHTWCRYEPGAASPADRYKALVMAKEHGIETWVSLEPVLDPDQSLKVIEETHGFVDLYKIGILNHVPNDTNWRRFGTKAIELCQKYGKRYYVKHDLARHLSGVAYTSTDTRTVTRKGKDHATLREIPTDVFE